MLRLMLALVLGILGGMVVHGRALKSPPPAVIIMNADNTIREHSALCLDNHKLFPVKYVADCKGKLIALGTK